MTPYEDGLTIFQRWMIGIALIALFWLCAKDFWLIPTTNRAITEKTQITQIANSQLASINQQLGGIGLGLSNENGQFKVVKLPAPVKK